MQLCGVGALDRGALRRLRRSGAQILDGPRSGFAQFGCGVERPIRIAEHGAGEEDEIGVAFGNDRVGLMRVSDHANGGGGYGGFCADAGGEWGLEGGADGDFGVGNLTTGGDIDEVDSVGAQVTGKDDGIVDGPAIVGPVSGGDADEEGKMVGPGGADGVDNLEWEADTVVETAAIGVGALIGERREEFVEQIAVGGVDLDEVEARGEGAFGGTGEGVDHAVDSGLIERLRNGVVGCEGNGAGAEGLPSPFAG